jgi:hypothetical protein
MLTGRRFNLHEPVIVTALENNGERIATMIPASSVVEIISGTISGLGILEVTWEGKVFAMFASDIAERGDELCNQTTELRPAGVEDHPRKPAEKVRRAAASELR